MNKAAICIFYYLFEMSKLLEKYFLWWCICTPTSPPHHDERHWYIMKTRIKPVLILNVNNSIYCLYIKRNIGMYLEEQIHIKKNKKIPGKRFIAGGCSYLFPRTVSVRVRNQTIARGVNAIFNNRIQIFALT